MVAADDQKSGYRHDAVTVVTVVTRHHNFPTCHAVVVSSVSLASIEMISPKGTVTTVTTVIALENLHNFR